MYFMWYTEVAFALLTQKPRVQISVSTTKIFEWFFERSAWDLEQCSSNEKELQSYKFLSNRFQTGE